MAEAENIALIKRFIELCPQGDTEEVISFFTEDAVWWNAPWSPIQGHEAIRDAMRRGSQMMEGLPWELRHIAASGDVVLTERVDRFRAGGSEINVPCMGIFEIRDGLIAAWRDYWDLQDFQRQLPKTEQPPA